MRKFEELDVDLDDDYKGLGVRRGDLDFLDGDGSQDESAGSSQTSEESEEHEPALNSLHPKSNERSHTRRTNGVDDESFSGFESDHSNVSSSSKSSEYGYENGYDMSDADSATSALSSSEKHTADKDTDTNADETAKIRALLSTDASKIKASLSAAARSDIEKGRAIKRQRIAFDSLLNTRIKLQKALVASNTLATLPPLPSTSQQEEGTNTDGEGQRAKAKEVEKTALALWNDLHALRRTYVPKPNPGEEEDDLPFPFAATPSTPTSTMWAQMQQLESTARPARRATLAKWSERTTPLAPSPSSSMAGRNRVGQTRQPSLLTTLDAQLAGLNMEKLVEGSRVLRSCGAPGLAIGGQRGNGEKEHGQTQAHDEGQAGIGRGRENVYDDSTFYASLLRELVEQRASSASASAGVNGTADPDMPDVKVPTNRDLRVRKQVDRKASKGRKMRYQVHEKLQNFMVAEDRGSWGERQRGELFAGLLGRRVDENIGAGEGRGEGEEVDGNGSADEGMGEGLEGGVLRLFD